MKRKLEVDGNAVAIISALQRAGFESYIVGGAVRDLLLGRSPKDFDISTAASPEEVRQVFGRRSVRIIGKRFRLAHVYMGRELFEVSTFRKAPEGSGAESRKIRHPELLPEHMIVSDNAFGTAKEDAWRRDFTVNALFYNPLESEILDYTGHGLADIDNRVVRAIGDPRLRFEEDPVRLLRALKLVAQYDFNLDDATENALFADMPLICHAAPSRLALELEKILQSCYGDKHLQVFHDYGLLKYLLPEIDSVWDTAPAAYMMKLFFERNCRVDEGRYRNSISLAIATIATAFVESACGRAPGELWPETPEARTAIRAVLDKLFRPQNMMAKMNMAAERILLMQPELEKAVLRAALPQQRSYAHACELYAIRHVVAGEAEKHLRKLPPPDENRERGGRRSKHKERR